MSAQDLTWRKSSYSNGSGGTCVEIALGVDRAHVRDSKDPGGGTLVLPSPAWSRFVADFRESTG